MSERPHQRDGYPAKTVNCNAGAGSVAGALAAESRGLRRPVCPCGMPMVRSTGGWMCPDQFAAWILGESESAHELKAPSPLPADNDRLYDAENESDSQTTKT